MKKWLLLLLVIFLLAIASIYLLVPAAAPVVQHAGLAQNAAALHRNIMNEKAWKDWWPGTQDSSSKGLAAYSFNGYTYTITDKNLNALAVTISGPHFNVHTLFNILPLRTDSVGIVWEGRPASTNDPLRRVQAWRAAKTVKADMDLLLQKLKAYYTPDHLYALPIREAYVEDSTLISTYGQSTGYPTTAFIYGLIGQLQAYITTHEAAATGAPMLNIVDMHDNNYLTRVALPVNKVLPPAGNISYKWMLGGGNILVADVKGGPTAIEEAQRQLEFYVTEHGRIAPAIPFQSLITDRREEKDSSRWITRLYYPVM